MEVELIKMSAPMANLALIGGNVEFGAVGAAAIPSVLRGAPLRFLFHTYFRPLYWLYANPEIRDLNGLKGKRVGVSGIGSGSDTLLRELLQRHGLEGGRLEGIFNYSLTRKVRVELEARGWRPKD